MDAIVAPIMGRRQDHIQHAGRMAQAKIALDDFFYALAPPARRLGCQTCMLWLCGSAGNYALRWWDRRCSARSPEDILLHVRIAPAPHHIVQEIVMNVDENVEREDEQAGPKQALVIRKNSVDRARHAIKTEKSEEDPNGDE